MEEAGAAEVELDEGLGVVVGEGLEEVGGVGREGVEEVAVLAEEGGEAGADAGEDGAVAGVVVKLGEDGQNDVVGEVGEQCLRHC